MTFGVIASEAITPNYEKYEGEPLAYWNKSDTILEIANQQNKVFDAIEKELTKTQNSGYSKYNNGSGTNGF